MQGTSMDVLSLAVVVVAFILFSYVVVSQNPKVDVERLYVAEACRRYLIVLVKSDLDNRSLIDILKEAVSNETSYKRAKEFLEEYIGRRYYYALMVSYNNSSALFTNVAGRVETEIAATYRINLKDGTVVVLTICPKE